MPADLQDRGQCKARTARDPILGHDLASVVAAAHPVTHCGPQTSVGGPSFVSDRPIFFLIYQYTNL
jgi:hypothetical protein